MPRKTKTVTLEEWAAAGKAERRRYLAERGPRRDKEPSRSVVLAGPRHPWITMARYVIRQGRPVIRELTIAVSPRSPEDIPLEGLTATDLRRIGINDRNLMYELVEWSFGQAGLIRPGDRTLPPKHRQKDDDFYAAKANEYLEALSQDPRRPRVWLAEQYQARGQRVTGETVRDWIYWARQRGFLTPARPGRAGAEPTDKLREWNRAQKRKGRKP